MGPVFVDGTVQENQLTDEDYVIYRTKNSYKQDPSTAKAWMITAKTLFPRNFAVQLEAYLTQKADSNPKEAARYFSSLFFDFPNEAELWQEVQEITKSLQNEETNNTASQFHRDLFSHMLTEVQHQLLLSMAERAEDTMEHCRLMMVVLTRLPQFIDIHGKKLVDTLLSAEKHCHFPTPVNFYRKMLVIDLMPILLNSKTIDIPQKQLHQLIMKSLEFYVCWSVIDGSSLNQGMEGTELKTEESWPNLFQIMFSIGRKLGWELGSLFSPDGNRESMCQSLWNFYRATPLGGEESPNFRQLLYCTAVLLMESLFQYIKKTDPLSLHLNAAQGNKAETTSFLLVRSFFPSVDHSAKLNLIATRRNDDTATPQSMSHVTVTKSCPTSTAALLLSNFATAISCWELLHQTEELRNEFGKICVQLRSDTWTWLPNFVVDGFLYRGMYPEALNRLQSVGTNMLNSPSLLIKCAGILFSLGNYVAATEQILHAISKLTLEGTIESPPIPIPTVSSNAEGQHPLHFISINRIEVVQYSVSVLVACLRELTIRTGSDLAAGHLVVLLQYDWPNNAILLEEVIDKIKRQGQFSYPLFVTYVIQVDILEEFAFMATDHGGAINMDIFPSSAAQLATQRRMTTRRGDQGAREDFRTAMKRQMSRSPENVRELIMRFIVNERESLLRAVKL